MKKIFFLLFGACSVFASAQICFNEQEVCFQFVSPRPGSAMHHINSRIVVRHGDALDLSLIQQSPQFISVSGAVSGSHECNVWLASDGKSMQLDPLVDFALNELVTVNVSGLKLWATDELIPSITFSFTTSTLLPPSYGPFPLPEEIEDGDRDYPTITELVNINPAPGNIFMNTAGTEKFIAILDSSGGAVPLWFEPTAGNGNDFKKNENGLITYFNRIPQNWSVMNQYLQVIDSLKMINGYLCDDHECMYYPDGHYFLQCYDHQIYDMSNWVEGGNPEADVTGYVWQEIDENDDLIMQWRTWDYFVPTQNEHISLTGEDLDLWHGNAIERDADGNVHISFRNIDEVTKIDGLTGDVLWRLGNGMMNQFTFLNDDGFTYQHDARILANGNLMLYNNGNYDIPQISSCLEYSVDEENMTVTKVWEFIHPELLFAASMGGCRRLEGGHTLINWGNAFNDDWGARVTEVDENNTVVLEFAFPPNFNTYRAYKYDWFFDESVIGCTDPSALNFNPDAPILNDDYCQYDEDGDGFSPESGDCDDDNEFAFPGSQEIPNDGIDQDCDGEDLIVETSDIDEDGFDSLSDCNDEDDTVYPGAEEIPYDGIDQDCANGDLVDLDGDGVSGPEEDCNDTDENIYPGAEEIPYDGIDQDCADGDLVDVDGDGVNGPDDDCNDTNENIYPGAEEIPYDGIDQDCADGDLVDVDDDGYNGINEDCNDIDNSVYPGAPEIANDGIDQDCIGGDLIISVNENSESSVMIAFRTTELLSIQSSFQVSIMEIIDANGRIVFRKENFFNANVECEKWNFGSYHLSFVMASGERFSKSVLVE